VGASKTAWHVAFAALIAERAPPGIEVRAEVQLTSEPQRADLLLLRRATAARRDAEALTLRGLWPLLAEDSLVEFKSLSRPFRRGDLPRLLGYGAQYHAMHMERLRPAALTLVLAVPSITAVLREELDWMGWTLKERGDGYAQVYGNVYPTYVVAIDPVAKAEHDDLLGIFGHHKVVSRDAKWWLEQYLARGKEGSVSQNIRDLEGYDEMLQKLLESLPPEQRLAGLAPEQRLAGLAPEQRLAGLAPEQQVLALSDEVLQRLPSEFLGSLPPDVREKIRARIGH
jgi:hypothetical protein